MWNDSIDSVDPSGDCGGLLVLWDSCVCLVGSDQRSQVISRGEVAFSGLPSDKLFAAAEALNVSGSIKGVRDSSLNTNASGFKCGHSPSEQSSVADNADLKQLSYASPAL